MRISPQRRRLRAFTLVELIVLIVIMGVAAYALLSMFRGTMPRSPTPSQLTQAAHCAQERMELILGRRLVLPFNSTALDPSGAATCPANTALNVTVTGVNPVAAGAWAVDGNTGRYRVITVSVASVGVQLAEQNALIANY